MRNKSSGRDVHWLKEMQEEKVRESAFRCWCFVGSCSMVQASIQAKGSEAAMKKVQRCCKLRGVLGCGYARQRGVRVEGLDTHGLVRVLDVQVTTHQRLLLAQSGAGGANGLAGEDRHC